MIAKTRSGHLRWHFAALPWTTLTGGSTLDPATLFPHLPKGHPVAVTLRFASGKPSVYHLRAARATSTKLAGFLYLPKTDDLMTARLAVSATQLEQL